MKEQMKSELIANCCYNSNKTIPGM